MDDFLNELTYEGLAGRLKRLSDDLLYSTRDYYKTIGLDIEPNWHLIFLLLEKKQQATVTDLSQELKMSHPGIVKIVSAMKKKGYLLNTTDERDSRKQLLSLSDRAKAMLPEFRRHWDAGIMTMRQLVENSPHFLEEFRQLELKHAEGNYKQRTTSNLQDL